jgi:hypothetical protein
MLRYKFSSGKQVQPRCALRSRPAGQGSIDRQLNAVAVIKLVLLVRDNIAYPFDHRQ